MRAPFSTLAPADRGRLPGRSIAVDLVTSAVALPAALVGLAVQGLRGRRGC